MWRKEMDKSAYLKIIISPILGGALALGGITHLAKEDHYSFVADVPKIHEHLHYETPLYHSANELTYTVTAATATVSIPNTFYLSKPAI